MSPITRARLSCRVPAPPDTAHLSPIRYKVSHLLFRFVHPQNLLILRSLHRWLLDDKAASGTARTTAPPPPTTTTSTGGFCPPTPPPRQSSLLPPPSPGSVRVDAEFLDLVGAAGTDVDGEENGGGARSSLLPSAASSTAPEEISGADKKGTAEAATTTTTNGGASSAASFPGRNFAKRTTKEEAVSDSTTASCSSSKSTSLAHGTNGGGGGGGSAELARPRPGGRVQLSGKLCLTCCLPFNWPGESVAPPPPSMDGAVGKNTGAAAASVAAESGRSGGGLSSGIISGAALRTKTLSTTAGGASAAAGSGDFCHHHHYQQRRRQELERQRERQERERREEEQRRREQERQWRWQQELQQQLQQHPSWPDPSLDELSVIIDEGSFMLAVPDPPYSPLHGGLLLCVAPLRNTAAKIHPANPRVLELRVSTREEGQPGSAGGPGLFLPAPVGQATEDGWASFRGAGHLGVWHLVRKLACFACAYSARGRGGLCRCCCRRCRFLSVGRCSAWIRLW